MSDDLLAERFEAHRGHLRAVAYRMLGSTAEAEDAVQEAWLRLSRSDSDGVANLGGWLTTVVGRVCLDMLRSRRTRREEPLNAVEEAADADPERDAVLADSVGLALLVVLETLDPAERLAFVLHDMFAVPFDEIAPIVDRTPAAARQLASRARRRVQGAPVTPPEPDLALQRQVVGAFLAAARQGDFDALVAVLDPDVVTRSESSVLPVRRGAAEVARGALFSAAMADASELALVEGRVAVVYGQGTPAYRVLTFLLAGDRIREIDILMSPTDLRVTPLP
ncbi:MAG: sigma-70 family RNA polymerase sigma factor [Streptomyces sp.]|nr:sigma-70 family RNA polymerase sigma factor [Streptomyces sp.]NUS16077.1 sigma-70 family RNA polymerase sigma factor [Streptomyces sp.]